MTGCFAWLLLFVTGVGVILSLIRWFEQTADAVDRGQWERVILLLVFPFAAWFFPSRVGANRPVAVPRHEPVRGMGTAPKVRGEKTAADELPPRAGRDAARDAEADRTSTAPTVVSDSPPPGTPAEFIGLPRIPPKRLKPSAGAVDPDKLEKLRRKMREQGMLEDDAP